MRINSKVLFFAFVSMFVMSSCGNENDITQSWSEQTSELQVIRDLEDVNASLLSSSPVLTTRGKKNWGDMTNLEKATVVAADYKGACKGGECGSQIGKYVGLALGSPITGQVFGAALGAIGCGACASWLVWPENLKDDGVKKDNGNSIPSNKVPAALKACRSLVNSDLTVNYNAVTVANEQVSEKLRVNDTLVKITNLDDTSLTVGRLHNIILSVLDGAVALAENNSSINCQSPIMDSLINNQEFIDSCNVIALKASEGNVINSDRTVSRVMELFQQVLENYSSKTSDVAYIISKYTDVINHSNDLTDKQKEYIGYGLATALYSAKYWESEFNE